MNMGSYTTSERYLHAMNEHQVRAMEGAAACHGHDISHMDPQLIEIALNAAPSFNEGYASKVSEWKMR